MIELAVRPNCGRLVWVCLAWVAACSLDREPAASSVRSAAVMAREDAGSSSDAGASSDESARLCDTETTCDDGDPCTVDRLSVEVESCDVQCFNQPITRLKDADGCCPAGADPSNDSDCKAGCGNGLLDKGEECDGDDFCDKRCKSMFDPSLAHRYSFDGAGRDALDSAGAANGAVVGTELGGHGAVRLEGKRADYVSLPSGLLSALTSASIEVWLTWDGGDAWQRVFDFGNGAEGDEGKKQGTSFWYLTPRSEDDTVQTRMNFTAAPWDSENDYGADGRSALAAGEPHQLVATFDDPSKTLRLYVDGVLEGEAADIEGRLAAIDDADLWIGRSQYETDPPLDASVLELRIYARALAPSAVQRSFELGPDPAR